MTIGQRVMPSSTWTKGICSTDTIELRLSKRTRTVVLDAGESESPGERRGEIGSADGEEVHHQTTNATSATASDIGKKTKQIQHHYLRTRE